MADPAPPTDAQKLKNVLIPAAAAAAVIVLVGLVIGLKNPDGDGTGGKVVKDAAGNTLDSSSAGMASERPPLDSPEWKAAGGGLKTWDVKEGDGPAAKPGAQVVIHYQGWLTTGSPTATFDSSVKRNEPADYSLGGLIVGWQQGIPGMKPGGVRRLYVPADMAYGAPGRPGIPPNADLVFEVKLISSK